VREKFDRLAGLLTDHSPDRLEAFWGEVMGEREAKRTPAISDQLKLAMKASGLTPYALAKASGVNASAIQRFLHGERSLKLESVDRIAAALGLILGSDGSKMS
jgi:DNA-binding phage protein